MSDGKYPTVNGVEVLRLPPDGYVVDFDNPDRKYVWEHYLIFGILGPLAFIALCQRFYVKQFLWKGLSLDDLFMFLAWACSVVTQALMVWSVAINVLGCHIWEVPLDNYRRTRLPTYITAGIFMLCNGFTKLSLLTFYLPLSPQTWWRVVVWISIALVTLYTIIITAMLFFYCSPPEKAYKPDMEGGSCINAAILYIATAVSNIITDLMLFLIPIPMVVQLRMSVFQKLGALLVFAIGSMTVTTSVVRLVYLMDVLNTDDLTRDAARANVWSLLEANLFIICGSMPTIRKFFKHFAPRLMGVSSADESNQNYGSKYANKDTNHNNNAANTSRSRKMRSQYEVFDDHEMQIFHSANRDNDDGKNMGVNQASVDGGSETQPDNGSEKAILETKTSTLRYD